MSGSVGLGGFEVAAERAPDAGEDLGTVGDDAQLAVVCEALAREVLRADEHGAPVDADDLGVDVERRAHGVGTHLGAAATQIGERSPPGGLVCQHYLHVHPALRGLAELAGNRRFVHLLALHLQASPCMHDERTHPRLRPRAPY